MRKGLRLTVVALLTLSLAAACSRSENSVTGPPNLTRTLSGKVLTVGDLAGSSPAGINVSSNGQVAVTDAAGQFTFTSLPDKNVQMAFTRADGISASATVNAGASAVVVELQKTQASVTTTQRGQTRELQGLILEVTADSITVNNASTGGPVTAKITASTRIWSGNQTLTVADLEEGDKVHVRTSTNDDGTLTAVEIILQEKNSDDEGDDNGGDQGQVKELEGLIEEVSDTSITVHNASTHRPETASITGDTVIRRGGTRLQASDLKKGDRVHVRTTGERDALVAVEIILQKPA